MNLFMTSPDPAECASTLDDLRVVNQLRETCQLLSGAVQEASGSGPAFAHREEVLAAGWMYAPTHLASPCARWVRGCRQNFQWTVDHALALSNEYLLRYPRGSHKSVEVAHRFLAGREFMGALFELAIDLSGTEGAPGGWV